MGSIKLLDCTLRDGGYVNEWCFGYDCIRDICKEVVNSHTDIVELGFLRNICYDKNSAIFSDVKQLTSIIAKKKKNTQYAVMCEALNPLPIEKISKRTDETVDVVRVIVWKSLLQEGLEYCKGIVERGYQLCIQPNRVDQYTKEEFAKAIELFNELNPMAVYVVDSFGLLDKNEIVDYAQIADKHLKQDIALGYHGHNNLMQAYGATQAILELNLTRDVIIDASVYGIGRGAGNLNIELIAKYLNENYASNYDLFCYINIYEKYIKDIYRNTPWGYSTAYYLTALHRCNPMYAGYFDEVKKLPASLINKILGHLSEREKVIFTHETAEKYFKQYYE